MVRSVGLSVIAAGVAASSYPLYLHFLGYRTYGLWLVLSSVIAFSQLGNLGLSQAVAKQIAEENARGNFLGIKECVSTASAMISISGALLVALVTALRPFVVHLLGVRGPEVATSLAILPFIACLSVYLFLTDLSNNVLNGLGRIDLCNACNLCSQSLTLVISIPLLLRHANVWSLLIATTAAYASTHLLSNILARRISGAPLYSLKAISLSRAKALLSFGSWMLGSSMLNMLISPVNRTLLARYGSLSIVPIYDIGMNAAGRLRSLVEVGHKALSTEVSRLCALPTQDAQRKISDLVRKSTRPVIVMSVPVIVALLVIGTPLKLWLGSRFVPEITTAVRIMVLANYLSLFATPAYYVLIGRGRARDIFLHFLIQCCVNFAIVGGLISFSGNLSASGATSACAVAVALSAGFLIWREKRAARAPNHVDGVASATSL
ncbi:MAG: oligosaccharide flippase family protein [Bryobacteraceae bacterium]